MEKEFLDKLKTRCNSLGIDIDMLGDSELLLIYNGTTFDVQYFMYNNTLEVPLTIVSMTIHVKWITMEICGNFINWNWKQCLEKSHRYGIKSKHLKRYYWKIYERKQ